MTCLHCAKPFTTENPAYRDLLLHRDCYQAVGGCADDQLPLLPAHHSHGDRQTDLLAQKVNYAGSLLLDTTQEQAMEAQEKDERERILKPAPLDTSDMTLNEVLVRLRISKTNIKNSFGQYEFRRAGDSKGELLLIGNHQDIWHWLRNQKEII